MLKAHEGVCHADIARHLGCDRSTVIRTLARFEEEGENGLRDRRSDAGGSRATTAFRERLVELVREADPRRHGWERSGWTCESLALQMKAEGFPAVSERTMSRLLKEIGARRGRPRPIVLPRGKGFSRRIRRLKRLIAAAPRGEVFVYEDEVDIHLNPKIGAEWMMCGEQRQVITPGQNVKRYIAGTMDARTGRLVWVTGDRKNSNLFVQLLWRLKAAYRNARHIHVVLDNYCIHRSRLTRQVLAQFKGRIILHFLPSYCPQANRIERLWLDLHTQVTRNHRRATIAVLMNDAEVFMVNRSKAAMAESRKKKAA